MNSQISRLRGVLADNPLGELRFQTGGSHPDLVGAQTGKMSEPGSYASPCNSGGRADVTPCMWFSSAIEPALTLTRQEQSTDLLVGRRWRLTIRPLRCRGTKYIGDRA